MPEYQTTANDIYMIRGNGKVEVALYTAGEASWLDVGAVTDLSIEEQLTVGTEENDNADNVDRVSKQEVSISFTQIELLNLDVWETIRNGLDTIVMDSTETKIFSGNQTELPQLMLRITTKNDGRPVYFTAYKCQPQKGFTFEYQADDADDRRIKNPLEFLGRTDSNRNGYVWEIESDFFVG